MANVATAVAPARAECTDERDARLDGLGAEIRRLRGERGLSAAALAREVGVSPSLISQIERSVTTPSIEVLWAIARALNVSMGAFFQQEPLNPESAPATSKKAIVVKSNARKRIALPNSVSYDLLSPDLKHQIEFTWAEFEPGEASPHRPYSHEGEEQMVVVEGEIHFWVDGDEFILSEGDSITIDSGLPHRAANLSRKRAIVVAAMTPPSF